LEELLDKAQAKMDHIDLMEQQKAAEQAPKQEEILALKAEVATLNKTVNKFKKGNRKEKETSLLTSLLLTLPTKAAVILQRSNERRRSPERIGLRSSTQSPSLQTLTHPSSKMGSSIGDVWLSTMGEACPS
jgi:hypothetical protein